MQQAVEIKSKLERYRLSKSLRFRLLLSFCGLTVGSILIIAFISGQSSYQSLRAQQFELFEQIAVSIEDRVLAIFDQAERDFRFLDSGGISKATFQEQRQKLQSLVLNSGLYHSAGLLSLHKSHVTQVSRTTLTPPEQFTKLTSSELFIDAINSDRRHVEVLFDPDLLEPVARLVVPLAHTRQSEVSHVLYGDLRLKAVWEALAMVGLEDGREAYVISSDGRVVAHRNPSIVLSGAMVDPERSELREGLSGKLSVIYSLPGRLNSLGLQVVVEQPILKAYLLIRTVLFNVSLISFVFIVLAYITWTYLKNRVINPLNQLADAARDMSDGVYPQPLNKVDIDELNIVLSSFNEMVSALKAASCRDKQQAAELAAVNQTLEDENRTLEMTERMLRKNQNLLKHAQKIARLGNWEADLKSGVFSYSSEVSAIFELTKNEEKPRIKALLDRVDAQERGCAEKNWRAVPPQGQHIEWINKLVLDSGVEKYVAYRSEAIYSETGDAVKVIGILQDISLQRRNELKIWRQAHYDFLTGLVNRNLFQDRLEQAVVHALRHCSKVGLLFIDLDNFKMINDTLGHGVGDQLLKEVAQRLLKSVREEDTVARLAGDEFAIILGDISSSKQVETVAEKVLNSLAAAMTLSKKQLSISASVGAAIYPDDGEDLETLLRFADKAMYQAKHSGKNAIRFYDPQIQQQISQRISLESELRIALEKQQFELYYQSQIDNHNCVIGAEALIRWVHPLHGLVSPDSFIPLAEETGLIIPIGDWVLKTVCQQLKNWQDDEMTAQLTLSVNVSYKQFRQPDFVAKVSELVTGYGLDEGKLKIELTETILVDDMEMAIANMEALQKLGILFSLDDFGTGYSSLQYLRRLPLSQLKIDRSFVSEVETNNNDRSIVKTIILMANTLGINVIAEGVETEQQMTALAMFGCYFYQGYFYNKPAPIYDFEFYLGERNESSQQFARREA